LYTEKLGQSILWYGVKKQSHKKEKLSKEKLVQRETSSEDIAIRLKETVLQKKEKTV
jgi:hypothetical protein